MDLPSAQRGAGSTECQNVFPSDKLLKFTPKSVCGGHIPVHFPQREEFHMEEVS